MPRLIAAVPPLATAVTFAVAWVRWGSEYATVMAKTIQLEFLGIFFGAFILVPLQFVRLRWLRWVAVAVVAYVCVRSGYALLGWTGAVGIAGMCFGTYGAFLMPGRTDAGDGRGLEIGVRWFVSLIAYGLTAEVLELPQLVNTWTDYRNAVALGAVYFGVLAAIEATPLYAFMRGVGREERGQ